MHGVCLAVTNSGPSRMVPAKTAAEWLSFRTNPGSGISLNSCVTYSYSSWSGYGSCSKTCGGGTQTRTRTCRRSTDNASVACSNCGGVCSQSQSCNTQACAPACGGEMIGGYCWYLSAYNQSCDQACSGRGGCNLTGTRNYAGSGGTNARCDAVMDALATPRDTMQQNGEGDGIGCSNFGFMHIRYAAPTTTCGAKGFPRACACNN
jgi:hypothetical protein